MSSLYRIALGIALFSVPAVAPVAHAQSVQVFFSGKITQNSGHPLLGSLAAGDDFTGGFIYDLSTADDDGRPNFGFFQNGISGFHLDFGAGKGGLFSQGGTQTYNNIQIGDDRTDFGPTPFDGFYAYANMEVAGYSYVEGGISLQSLLNPLASAGLPLGIDWSKFLAPAGGVYTDDPSVLMGAGMEFHAVFGEGCELQYVDDCAANVYGEILSMRAQTVVPEPATFVLVASGLLLLLVRARKRSA